MMQQHQRWSPPPATPPALAVPVPATPPNLSSPSSGRLSPASQPEAAGKQAAGIPPLHPQTRQSPTNSAGGNGHRHSRSLTQPPFFSFDALPALTFHPPTPLEEHFGDVSTVQLAQDHRRSQSDVPFAVLKHEPDDYVDGIEDPIETFMDLDGIDLMDSSGADEFDSRGSGGADSSENEADSQKKNPAGAWARHGRSLSMDSSFMVRMNFAEEPPMTTTALLNGRFSEDEKKKIEVSERLLEMVKTDPKRVKRILANRRSAARSKERKVKYMAQLEQKVHMLQTEATSLSAQLTLLQRESMGIANQNGELRLKLQTLEKQAQLRDALTTALTAEVHRLRALNVEAEDDPDHSSKGSSQNK